ELARRLRESTSDVPVDGAFERLSSIIAEMRDAITRTRMQRIENLFVALPRMVRDLSAELGKQVLVDIEGGDVELDREMIALICEAGLSTASQVTAISGRGVGMDVVRSNVERIGGIVEVDSKLGEGTRMTLRVPLTLTIIPALTVSIAGQHFAIPRSAIDEI